jgi:hypothetical protein
MEVIIDNSAAAGSTDETSRVRFRHVSRTAGEIRCGRQGDFSSTANMDGFLSFHTVSNDVGVEAMRIDPTGNVGIGTVTPTSLSASTRVLHVHATNAELKAETDNNAGWAFSHYKSPQGSWTVGMEILAFWVMLVYREN